MPTVDMPALRTSAGLSVDATAVSGPRSALIIATARYQDPQLRRLRVPVHGADSLATGQDEPLPGHAGFVNDVTFSSDGRMLASAGKDGTVRLWR